jgi:short-subunit dehydrogenase
MAIVCSGVGDINPLLDYTIEKPTIETNVMGWTFVIDMLYNIFERQKYGHLVAITSIGGLRGEPMSPAYSASKAYQINYMEALRKKAFKDKGQILVTDIRPGLVDTAMAKGDGLFWVMPVEKVARQICNAIQKQQSKAYVTKRWCILANIIKILPYWIYKRM